MPARPSPAAAGRCRRRSAPRRAPSCRDRCARRCRASEGDQIAFGGRQRPAVEQHAALPHARAPPGGSSPRRRAARASPPSSAQAKLAARAAAVRRRRRGRRSRPRSPPSRRRERARAPRAPPRPARRPSAAPAPRAGAPAGSRYSSRVASSAASDSLSMRIARASGWRRTRSTASARPTTMPACGPPSSLSPEKQTSVGAGLDAGAGGGLVGQVGQVEQRAGAEVVDQRHAVPRAERRQLGQRRARR